MGKYEKARLRAFLNSLALSRKRTCYSVHRCALCACDITIGQKYRGEKTHRRAHEECFQAVGREVK